MFDPSVRKDQTINSSVMVPRPIETIRLFQNTFSKKKKQVFLSHVFFAKKFFILIYVFLQKNTFKKKKTKAKKNKRFTSLVLPATGMFKERESELIFV